MLFVDWFWRFIGYSFLGWLMETTIFTIEEHRWVNRGFLNGPVCPIYGSGSLMILLLLAPFKHDWLLLLAAGIALTTVLEYLTSWVMEKLFHARWWDYSDKPFNLHGRITLQHSLGWGALCLALVYGIDPIFSHLLAGIPVMLKEIAAVIALLVLLIDLVVSVIGAINLNRQLARLHEMTRMIRLKNTELSANVQQRLAFLAASFRELRKQASTVGLVQRRLLKAFPRLQSIHYQDTLKKLRHWLKKSRFPQVWPIANMNLLRNQTPIMQRLHIKNGQDFRLIHDKKNEKPGKPGKSDKSG